MHTVDASSDPSVSLVERPASNSRGHRDSAFNGHAQAPLEFGHRAMVHDEPLPSVEKNPEIFRESDAAKVAPGTIPSWKRILDVTCILLTSPLWLPVVLVIALWIKIVSPGPILFRQE